MHPQKCVSDQMPLEGLCSQTEARWFYWGWSRVYDAMQPFFTSDEMRNAGLDLAHIKGEAPKVLDVGAGTGSLTRNILGRFAKADITLLDQSPDMLKRARLKPELQRCSFELADAQVQCTFVRGCHSIKIPYDFASPPTTATSRGVIAVPTPYVHFSPPRAWCQALPFPDNSFDHVVSSGSLYYYPDPVTALQEQLRVVRPGGTVLAMGSLQVTSGGVGCARLDGMGWDGTCVPHDPPIGTPPYI